VSRLLPRWLAGEIPTPDSPRSALHLKNARKNHARRVNKVLDEVVRLGHRLEFERGAGGRSFKTLRNWRPCNSSVRAALHRHLGVLGWAPNERKHPAFSVFIQRSRTSPGTGHPGRHLDQHRKAPPAPRRGCPQQFRVLFQNRHGSPGRGRSLFFDDLLFTRPLRIFPTRHCNLGFGQGYWPALMPLLRRNRFRSGLEGKYTVSPIGMGARRQGDDSDGDIAGVWCRSGASRASSSSGSLDRPGL